MKKLVFALAGAIAISACPILAQEQRTTYKAMLRYSRPPEITVQGVVEEVRPYSSIVDLGCTRCVLIRGTWPGSNRSVPVLEGSDVAQVTVTLDAGAVGPWHYHLGPAIIIVEKGEFTLTQDDSDCSTATYRATDTEHPVVWEEAFNIHRPANLSSDETKIYITFLDIPHDSPDMIAADPQVCNQNSASPNSVVASGSNGGDIGHIVRQGDLS